MTYFIQKRNQLISILGIIFSSYLIIQICRYGILVPFFNFLGHPDTALQAAISLEEFG